MKIAVLGAGAMGCLYGAYLSQKNDVTLLDVYQPQVDAIQKNGLIMIENKQEKLFHVNAALSGTDIGHADLVLVFVKSTQTYDAVKENQKLIGDKTLVMTLQNGAGNDRDILKFAKHENIIIGTSKHNSVTVEPGKFQHTAFGVTTIGTMDSHSQKDLIAADILNQSGLEAIVSDDIQRIIWSKLFVNMSVNTLTALLQTRIGYLIRNKDAWDFVKRVVYEGVEVAEADGTYFDRRETLEMVRKVCIEAGDGYTSMYQDRKNKRLTEIDKINGAVVEQAKLYGVPTPYNALIVDLIHAIEGTYCELPD
ncbi:ketopantoate reductase family protein [Anaeromicropila populeti]|uniref:2-dehydropantoate 2-reductase n=1 Tax=Anaeromicropila populeti TaxID=37658 RepID=A0A1I6I6G3_9FIRM|nr:2-dehydropantoate 2-reductase [Anaeromicropila populeti]SFR62281.1 2-dehydropantoate 2-reductase [Anaeromicropila populeti]